MKLRLRFPILLCSLLLITSLNAQQRCASYDHLIEQLRDVPGFLQKFLQTEKSFDNYVPQRNGVAGRPAVVTIPVVVHVVYNSNAENISDAQVNSQITVLNHDFDATNSDYNNYNAGYGAVRGDANIQFCLVQIKRVSTKTKSFNTNDNVKKSNKGGSDPVDPTRYLNIWCCDLGQGLLGYAQFPDGPLATDGVVIDYQAFGKGASYNLYPDYNLGRTATHEIGHWLGLRHIWGDATCGNDFVGDTPLHNAANFGCPPQGHLSTCSGTPLEMWMNYMDYTDDQCMYFFSAGQVARMNSFLDNNARLAGIVANADCTPLDGGGGSGGGGGNGGGGNGGGGNGNPHNPHNNRVEAGDFIAYPTVTNGLVNLEINAIKNGVGVLNIYNQSGALVYKYNIAVAEGINTKTLHLEKLSNGVYMIQLIQGTDSKMKKLIIQQ